MQEAAPLSKKKPTRVRATVSCLECHRRRKKCDRGDPCFNCSRRWPPVQCVYETPEITSSRKKVAPKIPLDVSNLLSSTTGELLPTDEPAGQAEPLDLLDAENEDDFEEIQLPSPPTKPKGVIRHFADPPRVRRRLPTRPSGFKKRVRSVVSEITLDNGPPPLSKEPTIEEFDEIVTREPAEVTSMTLEFLKLSRSLGTGIYDVLRALRVEASSTNARLFHLHDQIINPLVWSIDGSDQPPEIYRTVWFPFVSASPIITHINLLRASLWLSTQQEKRFLAGTSSVVKKKSLPASKWPLASTDSEEIIGRRIKCFQLLNVKLRSQTDSGPDDESIVAVAYSVLVEWCWAPEDGLIGAIPHMKGLKEMLRLRGGIEQLGQCGLCEVLVRITDWCLVVVLETESMLAPSDLRFHFDGNYITENHCWDSPLYRSGSLFIAEISREIEVPTAAILDQMNSVIFWVRSYMLRTEQVTTSDYTQMIMRVISVRDWLEALEPTLPSGTPNISRNPEALYKVIRLASLMWCRCILTFQPFSAQPPASIQELFVAISQVHLLTWKRFTGLWLFAISIICPPIKDMPTGKLSRSFLKMCVFAIGLREWQLIVNCMESIMAVQKWIRGGSLGWQSGAGFSGGVSLVEKEWQQPEDARRRYNVALPV